MEKDFGCSNPQIVKYCEQIFTPEDSVLKEIRERSHKEGLPMIQVGKMDNLHIEVLTRLCGAKKAVEIGTLGGYSGVNILRGMGQGGRLWTFEYHEKHASVAKESFKKAGFESQVKILLGRALENLPKIEKEGPFDLVFIDADKQSYPAYLKWAEKNLKIGGVILGDNTFGFGKIADKTNEEEITALQKFNKTLAESDRFLSTILPTGEGLTVAVKTK